MISEKSTINFLIFYFIFLISYFLHFLFLISPL